MDNVRVRADHLHLRLASGEEVVAKVADRNVHVVLAVPIVVSTAVGRMREPHAIDRLPWAHLPLKCLDFVARGAPCGAICVRE